jgi:hypothetical protein
MLEHVANHNINNATADDQCDSFRLGLDVMAYSFNVLDSDVEIFQFLLMCQPLVFFPPSFVIQAKVLCVIIGSKWRSFECPSHRRFFRRAFATKAYAKLAADNNNFRRDRVAGCNGKSILYGVFRLEGRLASSSFVGMLWSRLRGLHRSSKNAVNGKGTSFGDSKMHHGLSKLKYNFFLFY